MMFCVVVSINFETTLQEVAVLSDSHGYSIYSLVHFAAMCDVVSDERRKFASLPVLNAGQKRTDGRMGATEREIN